MEYIPSDLTPILINSKIVCFLAYGYICVYCVVWYAAKLPHPNKQRYLQQKLTFYG